MVFVHVGHHVKDLRAWAALSRHGAAPKAHHERACCGEYGTVLRLLKVFSLARDAGSLMNARCGCGASAEEARSLCAVCSASRLMRAAFRNVRTSRQHEPQYARRSAVLLRLVTSSSATRHARATLALSFRQRAWWLASATRLRNGCTPQPRTTRVPALRLPRGSERVWWRKRWRRQSFAPSGGAGDMAALKAAWRKHVLRSEPYGSLVRRRAVAVSFARPGLPLPLP